MSTEAPESVPLSLSASITFHEGPNAVFNQVVAVAATALSVVVDVRDFTPTKMTFEISVANLPPEHERLADLFELLGRAIREGRIVLVEPGEEDEELYEVDEDYEDPNWRPIQDNPPVP